VQLVAKKELARRELSAESANQSRPLIDHPKEKRRQLATSGRHAHLKPRT